MTRNPVLIRLGAKVKKVRLLKEMTQNELATSSGIDKARVSRIESGQTNPTVETLHKLSEVLKVDLSEFFLD